ncbi:MAG: hypothetical protein LBR26_03305 [Prevotella sp.]|nr:hypothetical protein [Prevotella sp.]
MNYAIITAGEGFGLVREGVTFVGISGKTGQEGNDFLFNIAIRSASAFV